MQWLLIPQDSLALQGCHEQQTRWSRATRQSHAWWQIQTLRQGKACRWHFHTAILLKSIRRIKATGRTQAVRRSYTVRPITAGAQNRAA